MLTESFVVASVAVTEFGVLEVRTDRIVMDGDVEVARVPHRHVLKPGADVSGETDRVKAIAAAVWTPELLAAAAPPIVSQEG